jgi:hypothetical protein
MLGVVSSSLLFWSIFDYNPQFLVALSEAIYLFYPLTDIPTVFFSGDLTSACKNSATVFLDYCTDDRPSRSGAARRFFFNVFYF